MYSACVPPVCNNNVIYFLCYVLSFLISDIPSYYSHIMDRKGPPFK